MPRGRTRLLSGFLAAVALTVGGAGVWAAGPDASCPVRLTVEIDWVAPELPSLPTGARPELPTMSLEAQSGRVVDVVAWPEPSAAAPEARGDGTWKLGSLRKGRVRARVEAPLGGNLLVRAGTHATVFPVAALLEAPQRSTPGTPATITVRRLPWDAIEVEDEADGLAAPGAVVPVTVGFNILTAEPTEAAVRLTGELRPARGGERVWWCDQLQAVAINPKPGCVSAVLLQIPAPRQEGTYVLDLRASWKQAKEPEPASRLSRLIHRRRTTEPIVLQAQRRLTLVVVDPKAAASPGPAPAAGAGTIVDSLDLPRGSSRHRPIASGRAALAEPGRSAWPLPDEVLAPTADLGDRLRGLVGRGPDPATLGPADGTGLSWAAVGLKVAHPERPHRLTLTVAGGDPTALGVALVVPGDEAQGRATRVLLDSTGTGAPVEAGAKPAACSWLVWPDAASPVLVLIHRGTSGSLKLGSVALEELPAVPRVAAPEAGRTFGLVVRQPADLDRFGGDRLNQARNLAGYLEHVGATVAVLPAALRDHDRRRALHGQADEDALAPDRLELTLRVLAERTLSALVELSGEAALPGLPEPSSTAALERGVVRLNGEGKADGPSYNPLHPEVRAALQQRLETELALRRRYANLLGALIRLGPGATLAGPPDAGLDDTGYAQFVSAMLDGDAARRTPGVDRHDPARFAARRQYVSGPGKMPWLTWRARQVGSLYATLADAAAQRPGAVLVVATPTLDDGPVGRGGERADSLGESPRSAWQAVGLDLEQWPADRSNLVVLRGVGALGEPLARDLATHPDLDAAVAKWPGRGLLVLGEDPDRATAEKPALTATGSPAGGDEPLGHALAVLDAHWVLLDVGAVAGREERIGRFARVLRALPGPPALSTVLAGPEAGVAARTWTSDGRLVLGLANDTPYTIQVEAPLQLGADTAVDDLGRGLRLQPETTAQGRRLVLELAPFGVAASAPAEAT